MSLSLFWDEEILANGIQWLSEHWPVNIQTGSYLISVYRFVESQ